MFLFFYEKQIFAKTKVPEILLRLVRVFDIYGIMILLKMAIFVKLIEKFFDAVYKGVLQIFSIFIISKGVKDVY